MSKIPLLSVLILPGKKKWNNTSLQENLTNCYTKKLYTDVEIIIGSRTFKAHKNILAFYSPLLQKSLYGNGNASLFRITKYVKPEGFEILLRFLYSSKVLENVNSDDLVEACFAAYSLEMFGIKEILINYILCKTKPIKSGMPIAEVKFWSLLNKSRSLKFMELNEKLLTFAENHFISILYNEDFAKADIETIKLVLNKRPLGVPEIYILERIANWMESNRDLELLDLSVQGLLSCVHFERLSPKEFYGIISKHDNLISKRDSLDILMHLADPTVCVLPKWCYAGDKCSEFIPANSPINHENGDWRKIDKFRSLEDLESVNNLNLTSDQQNKAFLAQKDLRRIPLESFGKEDKKKSSIKAKSYGKTLQESFCQMLDEGLFTDITLVAKDGTKFPAHRLILALGSDVFAGYLYGAPPLKILHFDKTADVLKTMIRYFYGSGQRIPVKSLPSSLDLVLNSIDIALKYKCYSMAKACEEALLSVTVNPCVFWKILDQVNELVCCKLNAKALMKYAMTSTKELFDHDSFYKASTNSLVIVLEYVYLNMTECDILEYVARWLKMNENLYPTDTSRKELLKHIRFQALSAEQFFAFLQKHDDLLPKEDSLAILTFLFQKSGSLPDWCYSGPPRLQIFYDPTAKIGTNFLIPWKGSPDKGTIVFRCYYAVAISNKRPEAQIQFLELSLKIKPPKTGKCKECHCTVTVKPDDGTEPLTFTGLNLAQYQRYLLPVYLCLSSQKPKMSFEIKVDAKHSHKFYFISREKWTYENAVLEKKSVKNCLSDVIIDNFTSEKIHIPQHLLPENRVAATATDKIFQKID